MVKMSEKRFKCRECGHIDAIISETLNSVNLIFCYFCREFWLEKGGDKDGS